MSRLTLESEYLIKLIKSAVNEEPVEPAPEGIDWKKLFALSKSQQVYSIIAEVLDLSNLPEDFSNEMKVHTQNELLRTLSMKSEFQEIENELNEKQIKYMLLKGSVLRNYYPKQKMRQMSDYDILYNFEKRDELIKIMRRHGYRLTTSCENSDDFFKEPFFTFEWHRELFFEEAEFCPHFDLWKNSVQDENKKCLYYVDPTEHFVYTVCHMYKHYVTNGCGIRFLTDIYLFLKNDKSVDIKKAEKRFDEIGISDFAANAVALSKGLFGDGKIDATLMEMLVFMLSNGVYGVHKVDYEEKLKEYDNSKLKYILSRIFPSKEKMTADYKILEKKPYLLFAYYVIRMFTKMRYNSEKAKSELKGIKNTKK